MTEANRGVRERPQSPHTQVWRWHITMVTSILHRVTGVGLYVTALLAAIWAVTLAAGPDAYAGFMGFLGSPIGRLGLFVATVCVFFHLAHGIRHLVWDAGKVFEVKTSNASSVAELVFTAVASVAVWIIAAMMGAL
jgi:succinate dehydrogenase / fumarate reductase cytochrome b subunit